MPRLAVLYALLSLIWLSPTRPELFQTEGPRVTPLGTQRPISDRRLSKEDPPEALEDIDKVLRRTLEAHGGRVSLDSVRDSVAVGRITFFGMEGPKGSFDVTLVQRGTSQVRRTIRHQNGEVRQGSDGNFIWESFNGMTRSVFGGPVGNFIESQTTRSLTALFDSRRQGFAVRDLGRKQDARVVEVEVEEKDKSSRKTSYFIERETSRVTRVEWTTGEVTTLFGDLVPATAAYVLSDFRSVQGIPTPFQIERYVNGTKIEETRFSTVRYNASPKDDVFQP